jgi:hypothetical protein
MEFHHHNMLNRTESHTKIAPLYLRTKTWGVGEKGSGLHAHHNSMHAHYVSSELTRNGASENTGPRDVVLNRFESESESRQKLGIAGKQEFGAAMRSWKQCSPLEVT